MASDNRDIRPTPGCDMDSECFQRWYWPIKYLKQFCDLLGLPKHGTKEALRNRVFEALGNPGQPIKADAPKRKTTAFNWAKENLTRDTIITDEISFGPNLRGFLKEEIGKSFSCHSDFMAWVRSNTGATLQDAIDAWRVLEERKEDPTFRREIAECNNYLQYLRDARDTTPGLSLDGAKRCWEYKSVRPAHGGYVVFEESDVLNVGIDT